MEEARPRVLIIESDQELLAQFEQLLVITGYEVRFHGSRAGAKEIAHAFQPGIAVVAEQLSDSRGLEVLEDIREILPDLPSLLLADQPSEELVITALSRGVVDIIRKPFSMAELLLRIGTVVKRERHRADLEEMKNQLLQERKILLQYFSDDVVSKIVSGDLKNIMGESLTASILFIDIRNFTGISENLDPNHVAELLSLLFTDIMDLIFGHGGSVNKLLGDAILATFGCPFAAPHDAENAVKCALGVREMVNLFNQARPAYLKNPIKIGMGITTGRVFAGNVGSFRRMEYTVIGDVVNTASRLQALTKKADVDLLLDGPTRDAVQHLYKLRKYRATNIRGKSNAVDIYTIPPAEAAPDDITFF